MTDKLQVAPENAERIWDWLQNRDGLAVWGSVDLSDPGWNCTTPLKQANGEFTPKPHWKATSKPERVITNPKEVVVVEPQEVKRFHVAVRPGSQGLSLKVTDGGTRRIRKEVAKAEAKYGSAWYEFDYDSYDNAVILAPGVSTLIGYYIVKLKGGVNDENDAGGKEGVSSS